MDNPVEGGTPRRRVLRSLAISLGTAVALPVTAACANTSHHDTAADPTSAPAAGGTAVDVIMIIRHAEKPTGNAAPFGITADGQQDPESLTVRGWNRAGALTDLFAPAAGPMRSGLFTPTTVWASNPGGDGSKRPQQTVTPLAAKLGVQVNIKFKKGQESALAAELDGRHGVTLVAWQHEAIPAIVERLRGVTPAAPTSWPDDRFDVVWVFTRDGGGWRFAQVPQMLLGGDSDKPIG
ncbi:hypothetical protein [Kutzneria sp. CA-103260]|uniref:hypothetical protein n=1 Tax=Kutzneria sp. CA-103260 TaxID=2802641 RepID=UPI001BA5532A|nr:hypothetical protein [Kutzneria sp. CA-103260]QUQ64020.1 hypothetical protein JJ691_17400 [Kutzneria sp. CA-103260]